MLEMRPACERCTTDLPADAPGALLLLRPPKSYFV